ncbi:hypothetical protein D8674_009672 [Pyrus ussuriensis x Pyrus communis]|uniref:Uncharacterized protein n=1 Tax=Pyrus ussuriensis x Pyrus communis TaxID=2448454 RepID=A0A5N5FC07_9ROSA|nr:hypothetical protein D8674_009672 [Pyrus ussuriensis x Pyrus communis]
MAGAHCAASLVIAHPIHSTAKPVKPILSASVSVPSKPTRRRNHLRPKILKTLTRPYPPPKTPLLPELPPTEPVIPTESPVTPSENDSNTELSSDRSDVVAAEGNKVEELSVSVATPEQNGIVGKFSAKSVLKFGAYLVGAYLFQAFFTVWLLGNDNPDQETGKSKTLSKSKGKALYSNVGSELGNVIYLDEIQLDERIEEIRAMAREARKSEKRELKKGSIGDEDDVSDARNRIGIEKEVGERLVRLQRSLNSKREKLQGPYVSNMEKNENVEAGNSKEEDGTLLFKKKVKFKAEAKSNPKGFGGLDEHGESRRIKRGSGGVDTVAGDASVGSDGKELLDSDNDENRQKSDIGQGVSKTVEDEPKLLQNDGKHLEKGTRSTDSGKDIGAGTIEPQNGTVQKTRRGKSSEGVKSRKSRALGKKKSPSKKEIQETTIKSGDNAALSVNGSSKNKEAEKEPVANKVSGNRSKNDIDPWWLDLPYVLVIMIRRGSGSEGQGGLYTLKLSSQHQSQSDFSYTVAFEHRTDANNFCILLETFFEDLGDFRADIVPLPNKELRKAIKSDNMKLIFVKRGQLQLYAGQPFEEVETALRSLVEQE